jgi:hypothetical protein
MSRRLSSQRLLPSRETLKLSPPFSSGLLRPPLSRGVAKTIEEDRPDPLEAPSLPSVVGSRPDLTQAGGLHLGQASGEARGAQLRRAHALQRLPAHPHDEENSISLTRQNGDCYPPPDRYAIMANPSARITVSARERIPADRLRDAVIAAGGNIAAAARELGIARNSLYKRLGDIEIDIANLRAASTTHARPDAQHAHGAHHAHHAQQNQSAIFPTRVDPRTVPHMQARAATRSGTTHLRAPKTLSLRKDQVDQIRHARRRLAVALDVDLTDSLLLERFIDDTLESWVARQLQPPCARSEEKP